MLHSLAMRRLKMNSNLIFKDRSTNNKIKYRKQDKNQKIEQEENLSKTSHRSYNNLMKLK